MNLAATIFIYGGGPGSGCTGPDCGRKPGEQAPQILDSQDQCPLDKKFMRLQLTTGEHLPLLFENDPNLNWNWSGDKKTLHIEQIDTRQDEYPTGFTEKTVVDVPRENVKEWAPTDGNMWKN
jgi:hypothetical protein